MANSELAQQLELIRRGTVEIIQEQELESRLRSSIKEGRPLRVKAGFAVSYTHLTLPTKA